ncbi:MAG TPA: ankyrin repeat domain-containing protein [Candidatus Angelobacter sp.]|nr:ankyrin repeat domain-containing protein [Candidatus Angelobacter sp.]
MKLKLWLLAALMAFAPFAHAQTNDLTGLLQQGLFEEEANRNLDAAIADYQSLAGAFDKDRQTAATAIFRLGEVYRKLGKTNEAVAQYQRIIHDFGDQQTLVTLSRQNLAGLGASSAEIPSAMKITELQDLLAARQAQVANEQALLKTLKSLHPDALRQVLPAVINDAQLDDLMSKLDTAEQQLLKLKLDYSPDHPKYRNAEELVNDLDKKVKDRIDGILTGLEAKLDADTASVNTLSADLQQTHAGTNAQSQLQVAQTSSAAEGTSVTPITDEEQQEIRRIQVMIQQSPDLINAPGPDGTTPLQDAASKGQLSVAKYLLDHGADVNRAGTVRFDARVGETPLYKAAINGHKAMVELLISRGADINRVNPLEQVVSKNYTAVAEVLLTHNADVNGQGSTAPLHDAAQNGATNLIQLLLNHGADVSVTNNYGSTPLHLAARAGEVAAAKMLLAAHAPIEAKDNGGETPLHLAADAGKADMISLLIDSGASVDATNNQGATPLFLAVNSVRQDAVRVLLAHKADPNRPGRLDFGNGRHSPLVQPINVTRGKTKILAMLLDAGADPDGQPDYSQTPLFVALAGGNTDDARMLLEHGANPNRLGNGEPPLVTALNKPESKPVIPLLLEKGADPNVTIRDGLTPIFLTTDPEIGRWLIEHKADVHARSAFGLTPLMQVQTMSHTNYLDFLLESGANPDLQDTNGNTALHYATYQVFPEAISVLLAHKANPNIQNNAGFTPLDMAKSGESGFVAHGMWDGDNRIAGYTSQPDMEKKMAALLTQAGGLANLPKRDRIQIQRASTIGATFTKGSRDWNQLSLLEAIAYSYGFLTRQTSGEWKTIGNPPPDFQTSFRFPNFKKITVYRRTANSPKEAAMHTDVDDILKTGDCSRDVWLQWGDVVEIPEIDHPVDDQWHGLSDEDRNALLKCVSRQVTIKIKDVSKTLTLAPQIVGPGPYGISNFRYNSKFIPASFMLRSVLDQSKLIRVSSDLSRVKVTRIDPATKKTIEWTIDCTNPDQADLWLRDGDVIEVPEK